MQEFWIKVISVMVIGQILLGYNTKLEERSKDEEIAKLNAMMEQIQENQAAEMPYNDGNYIGEADGFGGKISVEVVVENGKITKIEILSAEHEDGAYLSMAEDIIPDILDAQSAEVDSISGATFSSVGIKDAVGKALEKAAK